MPELRQVLDAVPPALRTCPWHPDSGLVGCSEVATRSDGAPFLATVTARKAEARYGCGCTATIEESFAGVRSRLGMNAWRIESARE